MIAIVGKKWRWGAEATTTPYRLSVVLSSANRLWGRVGEAVEMTVHDHHQHCHPTPPVRGQWAIDRPKALGKSMMGDGSC